MFSRPKKSRKQTEARNTSEISDAHGVDPDATTAVTEVKSLKELVEADEATVADLEKICEVADSLDDEDGEDGNQILLAKGKREPNIYKNTLRQNLLRQK